MGSGHLSGRRNASGSGGNRCGRSQSELAERSAPGSTPRGGNQSGANASVRRCSTNEARLPEPNSSCLLSNPARVARRLNTSDGHSFPEAAAIAPRKSRRPNARADKQCARLIKRVRQAGSLIPRSCRRRRGSVRSATRPASGRSGHFTRRTVIRATGNRQPWSATLRSPTPVMLACLAITPLVATRPLPSGGADTGPAI